MIRQRALDLAICVLALPVLLILGAAIAVAVFLDSPGPIFYRALRIGRGGRPFAMLKFRTMRHGALGPPLTTADDERYTPLGRWLSRHRLDELPQVWNVLRGDMRIVGPRPEAAEFVAEHPEAYGRILSVLPGLTGPTQLAYAREDELLAAAPDRVAAYRESILPAKIALDLEYVDRPSLRRDLGCLWRTVALSVGGLRRLTLLSGSHAVYAAPVTRALVALSIVALLLTAVFAADLAAG